MLDVTFVDESLWQVQGAKQAEGLTPASDAIGVTDNHLFWSVDRQQFVPIGEMEIGERVQTYHGETKRIASKLPRPGPPKEVYNLEVYGEHVYFVGEQALLAHNSCTPDMVSSATHGISGKNFRGHNGVRSRVAAAINNGDHSLALRELQRVRGIGPKTAQRIVDSLTAGNPLPQNGVFARVMAQKYANAFKRGEGGLGGGKEVWVTAADDLAGVSTVVGAQKRMSLFSDPQGTVPHLGGNAIVQFRIKDLQAIGLRSPIQTVPPRGYGFVPGGRTAGGAREVLFNNGTAAELGAVDIRVVPLN